MMVYNQKMMEKMYKHVRKIDSKYSSVHLVREQTKACVKITIQPRNNKKINLIENKTFTIANFSFFASGCLTEFISAIKWEYPINTKELKNAF